MLTPTVCEMMGSFFLMHSEKTTNWLPTNSHYNMIFMAVSISPDIVFHVLLTWTVNKSYLWQKVLTVF